MNHPKNSDQSARARKQDLVIKELPDEVLVYDLKKQKAHCLNQTAAFVWNHCDGQTTVAEIALLLEKEWRKPVTEDVVWLALKQLSRANLLEEPIRDEEGMRASRRAVLRKLGTAAAMAPLVISLVAPTASAGSSVPPQCIPCTSFGSGANRTNNCPPVCNSTPGRCFNNASCNTGQGGLLATNIGCTACFNTFPQSSGWRAP
jgi:hypothetical protein